MFKTMEFALLHWQACDLAIHLHEMVEHVATYRYQVAITMDYRHNPLITRYSFNRLAIIDHLSGIRMTS
jgi:hypothetical protein